VELRGSDGEWTQLECLARPGQDIREAVDQLVKKKNWDLREFRHAKATLEDVFVELTQE
jgi:hypothetical protein